MRYITESDLRDNPVRWENREFCLAANERLTPSAKEFLRGQHVTVTASASSWGKRVQYPNPLCPTAPVYSEKYRGEKPEHMTLLGGDAGLVSKLSPRIALRGRLDSLIADIVLVQNEFAREQSLPEAVAKVVADGLAALRSWVGNILRAEVTGEALPALSMCGLSYAELRRISHAPLRYLNYGHAIPEVTQGIAAARLNRLRAQSREVELCALQTFPQEGENPEHADIILALNRLSSAFYILMVVTIAAHAGKPVNLDVFH